MLDLIVPLDRRLELLWLCDDGDATLLMRPNVWYQALWLSSFICQSLGSKHAPEHERV